MEEKNFFTQNKSIVAFATLEVLALISFMFGNVTDLLHIAGSLISIISFVFAFGISKNKREFLVVSPIIAVLFIISGIAAFGPFGQLFGKFSLSNFSVFFSIPLLFLLGYTFRLLKEIKIKNVLMVIGGSLGLLVLLSTFATWTQYGLFYSLIYKIKGTTLYYYNGISYDVTKEMLFLVGFKFKEVSIAYGSIFAVVITSFIPALFFIDRKSDKKTFYIYLAIGLIGYVSLLTIPNIQGLVISLLILTSVILVKYLFKSDKLVKIGAISLASLIVLGFVFYLVTIINGALGFKFTGILKKLFETNPYLGNAADVLKFSFDKDASGRVFNLLGFNIYNSEYAYIPSLTTVVLAESKVFEYQIIKEIGVIGSLILICALFTFIYFGYRYLRKSDEDKSNKVILASFIVSFFVFSTISYVVSPLTHDLNDPIYNSFLRNPLLMVSLFMFGYMFLNEKSNKEDK